MTSYRGVEAIDCVGMQLIVEPDLGLSDNLKPNRFFGTERKRFTRALHLQGPLFYKGKGRSWISCNNLRTHGKK